MDKKNEKKFIFSTCARDLFQRTLFALHKAWRLWYGDAHGKQTCCTDYP